MLDLKFIASVAERDIDLLVLEEFSVSDEFREWFAARALGEPVFRVEIGAWHSVVDSEHGESDLVFAFTSQQGQRIALLIENKIDAPPQLDQGLRYRLRGKKGVQSGYWEGFKTCVIAPQRYLASAKHTESYDVEVSYEELLAFFTSRRFRDLRYAYKASLIQEAIEQNRRGYQPEFSEAMSKYVANYCAYVNAHFPTLCVQEAKPRPAGSTWVMFMPPQLSKGIQLCHQLTAGMVKLFLPGPSFTVESVQQSLSTRIEQDMFIAQVGKSVAIAIAVPKLFPLKEPFEVEVGGAIEALQALTRLCRLI